MNLVISRLLHPCHHIVYCESVYLTETMPKIVRRDGSPRPPCQYAERRREEAGTADYITRVLDALQIALKNPLMRTKKEL
jgi:hypothetical protein